MIIRMVFIGIYLCLNHATVVAQKYDPEKVNKKAKVLYEKALTQIDDNQLNEGIFSLQKCVELDQHFVDAYLSLAGTYSQQKQYEKAIDQYNKAQQIDSIYFKDFYVPYSISLAGLGKFDKALEAINYFLSFTKNEQSIKAAAYRRKCYEFAVHFSQQHSTDSYIFTPTNLGDSINSIFLLLLLMEKL